MKATLILENGSVFQGQSIGAADERVPSACEPEAGLPFSRRKRGRRTHRRLCIRSRNILAVCAAGG